MYIFIFVDANYWDREEISSDHYQRPYQYFLRLSNESALDEYSFPKSSVQLSLGGEAILHTILEYVYIISIIKLSKDLGSQLATHISYNAEV